MALGLTYAFDPQRGETPQTIARRRAIAEAILGRARTPQNVGEGWHAIANGIVANVLNRRAAQAEQTALTNAREQMGALYGHENADYFPPAPTPIGNASDATAPAFAPAPTQASLGGEEPTVEGMTSYIREAAAARGIDPDVAVRVARSEGLAPGVWQSKVINKRGQRETSYGPFQLLVGGGLGDKFQEIYGVSPEDRSTWRQQIDFALDQAAQGGWSPWYGAAKVGVGTRTGLERARPLGYQGSAPAPVQATASGMTPDMVQSWAANAYAPPMPAGTAVDAVNALGTAQPVPVAETEEDILAQEALMAQQDPQAFQPSPGAQPRLQAAPQPVPVPAFRPAPPLPEPTTVQDYPVAPVQVAQAGGDLPEMAGRNPRPVPRGPSVQQLLEIMSNPFQPEAVRNYAGMLLEQKHRAPERQSLMNAGDGRIYDPNSQQWIIAPQVNQQGFRQASPEEAAAYGAAAGQFGPDGRFYPINPPSGMSVESDSQGGFRIVQGPGAGAGKGFTEAQTRDTVYSTRARGALPTLNQFEESLISYGDQLLDSDPTGIARGRWQSEDYQIARAAGDEFLQAILRKDTGAAITAQEQELYGKTYLPQPGDSPAVIAYKRQARERAIAAIEAGMSPAQIIAQERALLRSADEGVGLPEGITEDDIRFTMEKHGISREEVLRRLGIAP